MKTSEIKALGLTVKQGGKTILHGLDFTAGAGKVTIIAGPNGSGKSTLVRAISGELPYAGSITINGADIAILKAWMTAGMRAVLPQETAVSFPFTVAEIVRLGLQSGLSAGGKNAHRLVEKALERVDLTGFSGRFIQQLSGGERQRVQLARVLCQIWEPVGEDGPRWLIMDEPVSSLDVRHQLAVMDIARDYAAEGGGVIAVMHDLNLSALYADRIALMKQGRIAAVGTPEDVLTATTLEHVFDCPLKPGVQPQNGVFVLPHTAAAPFQPSRFAAE